MINKEINAVVLLLVLIAFSFAACNDDDSSTEKWKIENQKAYDEIKSATGWTLLIAPPGIPSGVYYKVEKTGTGSEHPIQTASVKLNYTGTFYSETVFDSGMNVTFNVNSLVRGFNVALQNMVEGDKWKICIPYYLGYGTVSSGSIPAYTTLFFEIELLKITQYP